MTLPTFSPESSRRQFLSNMGKAGLGVTVAGTLLARRSPAAKVPPSERIRLAVVGIRGRGNDLACRFAERSDCEIAYLCDVDQSLFATRAKAVEEIQGSAPRLEQDFRRALDDQSVDAMVIATPDHWHALATVWSCQAGKDVYVEKPASHSPWEGRQMVKAARRHDRIVQVGTQNRSAEYTRKAKEYLESGRLGTIHLVRVYNQKYWGNLPAAAPRPTPSGLDWDMWLGPAEPEPYNTNAHNCWNHLWKFSGGDIINDGVHQMDLARWLIGKAYPTTVYSTGGRFAEPGVLETPDTQIAVYQFDDLTMTLELSLYTPYMLKTDPEVRNSDMFPYWLQNATRIEIYGTQGLMIVGRHGGGWQVFGRPHQRQPVVVEQAYGRFPDPEHKQNFIDAMRTRSRPNADIEEGHLSTLLCQLANISLRLGGRTLKINPDDESIVDCPEAQAMLKRTYRAPWTVPDEV